jgi:hypothetical protein
LNLAAENINYRRQPLCDEFTFVTRIFDLIIVLEKGPRLQQRFSGSDPSLNFVKSNKRFVLACTAQKKSVVELNCLQLGPVRQVERKYLLSLVRKPVALSEYQISILHFRWVFIN